MSEKYRMFKQFMHNELGITKEDIHEWVKEAVREEARKVIQKTYDGFDVERELRNAINASYSPIRKDMVDKAASQLVSRFRVKLIDLDEK